MRRTSSNVSPSLTILLICYNLQNVYEIGKKIVLLKIRLFDGNQQLSTEHTVRSARRLSCEKIDGIPRAKLFGRIFNSKHDRFRARLLIIGKTILDACSQSANIVTVTVADFLFPHDDGRRLRVTLSTHLIETVGSIELVKPFFRLLIAAVGSSELERARQICKISRTLVFLISVIRTDEIHSEGIGKFGHRCRNAQRRNAECGNGEHDHHSERNERRFQHNFSHNFRITGPVPLFGISRTAA
nr:MAG TPA: hypothetical protein [Caudoviricetes sp.]